MKLQLDIKYSPFLPHSLSDGDGVHAAAGAAAVHRGNVGEELHMCSSSRRGGDDMLPRRGCLGSMG